MGPRQCLCFFAEALLCFSLAVSASARNSSAAAQLDSCIRNRAIRALPHHRTGRPYHIHLPEKFSAVEATAMRIRGSDLWLRGANYGSFRLPPGIFTGPYARRTLLAFQDLGNLSSSYYDVPGYILIGPVVGCLAYDASNVSLARATSSFKELKLRPSRDPISITFTTFAMLDGADSTKAVRCVEFGPNGSARVGGEASAGMTCTATGTGHFSVVLPILPPAPAPEPEAPVEEAGMRWWVWVAVVCMICGTVVVALVVAGAMRLARKRRMEEMEKRAEEGEVLENVWVGGSKMPLAAISRTRPAIESENLPSPRPSVTSST